MIDNKNLNEKYTIFSNNVRYYRKKAKLTQEQLAEETGLSTSYIKQMESTREYKNVTFSTMAKLSIALDIPIEHLFHNDKQ